MPAEDGPTSFPAPNPLLDKINLALRGLGSTAKWLKVPESVEGAEILRDRKIVMVDDAQDVIENFVPSLTVATDGKAKFIKYDEQKPEVLIAQILETGSDIVLLDYSLSENLKGSALVPLLKAAGFTGLIIGFSSGGNRIKRYFLEAGASAAIEKANSFPEMSIQELSDFVNTQK